MPEMEDRPRTGDAVICERTKEGHEMTQKRQKYWHDVMMKAELDPEKYSRWVRIPPQDADLVGKKIEMRIQFENDVFDDNGKVTGTEAFLHCFEGTVTGVRVNENGNLRSVLGTRSKWAVATIAWDVEFLAWGAESHHGLNPSLYANEKNLQTAKPEGRTCKLSVGFLSTSCEAKKADKRRGKRRQRGRAVEHSHMQIDGPSAEDANRWQPTAKVDETHHTNKRRPMATDRNRRQNLSETGRKRHARSP